MPDEWHVRYDDNSRSKMWCVIRSTVEDCNDLVKMFSKQEDAWQCAQINARKWRGVAVLHSKEGKIRDLRTYTSRHRNTNL